MFRKHSKIPVAGLCLACCLHEVIARDIGVSPGGGAISSAIASAQPGDTIRVGKGVYRETIIVPSSIAIVGEAGAVIDPSAPFHATWEAAPKIGKGVYRAVVKERPRTLFLGGRVVAEIDEKRTGGDGDWSWKRLLSIGTPRGGFKFIRAVWIYRSDEKSVYAHFENDADPSGLDLSAVGSRDAMVTFRGAVNASVRGLALAHGYNGILFAEKSCGCSVKQCSVGPWDKTGILLGGGVTECLVESNEVTRGAFEDWAPRDNSKQRYEIWQLHKNAGFYDRVGIDLLHSGAGNRIHANHVFETFDGIDIGGDYNVESLDRLLTSPEDDRDSEIFDNVIERTRDSGIELGAGCINVKVHHNLLRQTHGGLRFKLPRIGPVFIYRNVLLDGAPFNIWYSMDDSPAEGYVYHNTIVGSHAGLMYSSFNKPHNIGAPNWHYVNNLIVTDRGFFEGRKNAVAPVNFTADYNLVVGGGRPWPDDATKDQHSHYVDDAKMKRDAPTVPTSESPAIDAGLDLSTYFHGKPLPGCEPGCFKGEAPDIGAEEIR